jgi:hypothetical protein
MGGFAGRPNKVETWLCCGSQGNMGLFYAWDGIIRAERGCAKVNLLLNRASPWMDIYSYLPYEGKVVIKNKTANEAFVRIPLWADKKLVECAVNGRKIANSWLDNYVRFERLKSREVLTIRFPMVETSEVWKVERLDWTSWPGEPGKEVHTCRFRGNTLIEMTPPLAPGAPLYARRLQQYSTTNAPMKTVSRFVTPMVLTW